MDKARFLNDVSLLKKLTPEIWEFRNTIPGVAIPVAGFLGRKTKANVGGRHAWICEEDRQGGP
ncbi:hypothetical protein [Chryseolinea serpens]|uniref:hypothetical protein n=1 Tax=Chryseolinea serpens TaxID=947013 RepID=UPI001FE3AF21|nr:hypothetical protein [Chryseolinea serpens]